MSCESIPNIISDVASAEKQVIGQTAKGTHIEASIVGDGPRTVVLVGGLAGKDASSATVEKLAAAWEGGPYRLIAIPVANPDAARLVFPPTGVAYKIRNPRGRKHKACRV